MIDGEPVLRFYVAAAVYADAQVRQSINQKPIMQAFVVLVTLRILDQSSGVCGGDPNAPLCVWNISMKTVPTKYGSRALCPRHSR